MYILKILLSFIKKYKFTIILYIIFQMLAFPLEAIAVPQIYSRFFSILNSKTKVDVFIKYFLIIVFFLIIVNFSNAITTYIESFMLPEINEYIINYIFKNLLIKNENQYEDVDLGKLITRLSTVPQHLKELITSFCTWVLPRMLTIIIINIYFFYLSWELGLVSIILLLVFGLLNIKYFIFCSDISKDRHLLFEKKNSDTQDKLSNAYSIYSTGNLQKEILNYENKTKIYTSKFKENLSCLNKSTIYSSFLLIFIFICLNATSVFLYMKNKISYVNLIAIFITIIYYTPCIVTLIYIMPEIVHYYGTLGSVDKFIEELYNSEKENLNKNNIKSDNKNNIQDLIIKKGNIVINNLTFGYNDNNLFKNFYLTIKENESIAIIGPSGNGKSTLIKLIMGYYNVPNNTIFIDNIDINKFNLNDLRKQISYVNQNTKLFNTTLLENIQYGNDFTKDEIINLFNKLNINNIFSNLKTGLETNVGIDGNNLSGGQRQLVHILRCIGRKNKIIILDEPTSAIDKENTKMIISAIKEISKNNTLILITHDLSILPIVNRVITIKSGKIIKDDYNK
jgi:ABC-type multidrug transport system fused ATPase/permease subunit